MQALGLSSRKTATALGVSSAHISRIVNGKASAGPAFCNAIAEHFGESPIRVMVMAGWLRDTPEAQRTELAERLEQDPTLTGVLQVLHRPAAA